MMLFVVSFIILLKKRELVALRHCVLAVMWLSVFFACFFKIFSVSLPRGAVVNRMYLWKFLVILTCIRDT